MTFIDILLILIMFAALAFGFTQGLIKMSIGILGFYLALLVSAAVSEPFAIWIGGVLKVERTRSGGYQLLMFFLVLFTLSILIIAALFSSFRIAALPKSLLALDQVGGMLIGALFGLFILIILSTLVRALVVNVGPSDVGKIPFFGFIFSNTDRSPVMGILSNLVGVLKLLLAPIHNSENLFIFQGVT